MEHDHQKVGRGRYRVGGLMTTANGKTRVTPGKPVKPPVRRIGGKIMPPMPPPPEPVDGDDDFLQFWRGFVAEEIRPTKRILGVDVAIPNDLPLYYDTLEERMATSDKGAGSPEALALYQEMLTLLFGEGTVTAWTEEQNLTSLQLRVLTVWGMVNAKGRAIDFAEAGRIVRKMAADDATDAVGKPPALNRADRRKNARASSPTRTSDATGQPSKRTSRASTAPPPTS